MPEAGWLRVTFSPGDVALVGALLSVLGAGWAVAGFARRVNRYGPLVVLSVGALLLIGGNFYDQDPLSLLDVVALAALIVGMALSAYAIVRRRR